MLNDRLIEFQTDRIPNCRFDKMILESSGIDETAMPQIQMKFVINTPS